MLTALRNTALGRKSRLTTWMDRPPACPLPLPNSHPARRTANSKMKLFEEWVHFSYENRHLQYASAIAAI